MDTPLAAYIVEDNPLIRDNLIATLEELLPLQVVGTADDEAVALAWMSGCDERCDLMIVDIFLKRGSGLGVLDAAQRLRPASRRVVLSNYATPDMRRRCEALGAERVFDKSHDIEALIDYCRRLVDERRGGGPQARA